MEPASPSETPPRPPWWQVIAVGRNPRLTLVRLLALVVLTVVTFRVAFVPVRVTGISMLPGYKDGERRWISPLLTRIQGLRRGDVVAIRTSGRRLLYLKRIIGLPGERVRILQGQVQVDGNPLAESYVAPDRLKWNWPTHGTERVLGPAEYLVIGDNRSMPADAHYFGVADRERILGKLVR
ncbi:MAG: signal peptidase I [Verrucomicrobia bacterium]|nr:signal peptidase I [Verrucomicrobiota bacterium]